MDSARLSRNVNAHCRPCVGPLQASGSARTYIGQQGRTVRSTRCRGCPRHVRPPRGLCRLGIAGLEGPIARPRGPFRETAWDARGPWLTAARNSEDAVVHMVRGAAFSSRPGTAAASARTLGALGAKLFIEQGAHLHPVRDREGDERGDRRVRRPALNACHVYWVHPDGLGGGRLLHLTGEPKLPQSYAQPSTLAANGLHQSLAFVNLGSAVRVR